MKVSRHYHTNYIISLGLSKSFVYTITINLAVIFEFFVLIFIACYIISDNVFQYLVIDIKCPNSKIIFKNVDKGYNFQLVKDMWNSNKF